MTLDEAINHCLEVAENNEAGAEWKGTTKELKQRCEECAAEHRQLAEWLTELRELRRLIHLANDITGEDDSICEKYLHHVDGGLCVNDGMGASNCACCGNISHCDYNSGGADDE
jgi:hypothetical protein